MKTNKVIIIGPAFPFRGGIANFNNALAQTFYDRGTDVTLFSFTLQYPSFLFPGTTQYEKGSPPKDLKIRTIINSVNPFNWIRVARIINKENPDYVIIRYWLPFMAPCLGTIARLLGSLNFSLLIKKKAPSISSTSFNVKLEIFFLSKFSSSLLNIK